ncbi:hypothetical protein GPS59_01215 [Acinetobacter haemolyticus]|uniref:hypothetical protein n=1 Tax=Acinetobacter haemolyticus TaxID=29430 RepID=UPI0013736954|nr:hypothetical protein [Acinetobacter haemolyticus]NAR52648.1 hypothetical protein [Acinetobacter haemolyticus]
MNTAELEKMFKALEKSPTPSIALKRSDRLTAFITQNTASGSIYRDELRQRKLSTLQAVLGRMNPFVKG